MRHELETAYWALRPAIGATAFLAGLDKYFNLLANWTDYVSPLALEVLPFGATTLMQVVGVVEIAVGLAILLGWTRLGAYVASAWLAAIALNLVTTGRYFSIAVRDLVMAVAAYTLARLAEVRGTAEAAVPQHTRIFEGNSEHARDRLRA
ncbi:MAG: DoxX family membrane protein [Acidobacteria bacterium]|nr:DoxX family membrane protein [Acidobacteriota bacterium]